MGLLSLGAPKEKRTQLFFRDDGRVEFRKLEIEDTILVIKQDNQIVRGWKHLLNNQFPFPGYKNIGADMVTLSYDRGRILDPYHIVTDAKADAKQQAKKEEEWLVSVGEARTLKILSKPTKNTLMNRMITYLGITLILEIVGILIIVGRNRAGG